MSVEDFMENYFDDFPRNVKLASGLDPSVVTETDQDYRGFAGRLADIVSTCNDDLLGIHWVGDAADEERHEMVQMNNVANSQHNDIHEYADKNLTPLAQDLGTAKARIAPLAVLSMTGMSNGEPEREAAQELQQAYGAVGTSRAGELDYQGRASEGDGVSDRGASPSGPSSMNPASSGGGEHAAASSPQSADDAAVLGADAPNADQGRSAQNDGSGKDSGKGDSLGQGSPSGGSGAPGGSPDGGGPSGGPPPGGLDPSGFADPADDGLDTDGVPHGLDSSGLSGGLVGAGGFGGVGSGGHERPLTQKPSAGGTGKPTINFNAAKPAASSPGVIGGGGMAPGAAGRKDEKEHRRNASLSKESFQASSPDGLVTVVCNGIGEFTQGWHNIDEDMADEDDIPNYELIDRIAQGWVDAANSAREKSAAAYLARYHAAFPEFYDRN